ncbi:MAG: XdhC family protein [SAR324 cluster bacterium]|nr:XdhC family protein [SAR324 cluster bacterium]
MLSHFTKILQEYIEKRRPFAVATVIRVVGSASAKPGSKALIDEKGRNVHGWVGGGCAESLVREEALAAIAEGTTRIVEVDLDDEVLGVGMPCGGRMEVYIEPHLPPKTLFIAGHNRLAQHLAVLGGLAGYTVAVCSPKARKADFPTAARVETIAWDALSIPPDASVVIASDHRGHLPALRIALEARPEKTGLEARPAPPAHMAAQAASANIGLVASRRVSQGLIKRLAKEGYGAEALSRVRTPAGLDLGGDTLEEISLSILAEILAADRGASALPLRMVKGGFADFSPAEAAPAVGAAEDGDAEPELLIVGMGRLAEELARLGTLLGWRVTVNTSTGDPPDLPASARVVTGDLDFSRMEVGRRTYVIIATLHKGDHLSMRKAMEGNAPYIGLIASRKRSGLVLDYLKETGVPETAMANVFAPAGLELGAVTPAEIAISVIAEVVGVYRGGSCRPLSQVEASTGSGNPDACLQLFE